MKQGDKVKIHYTGSLNDGTVFDSSEGREPLEFTIGEGQVIAGFESAVKNMNLDEEKTIKLMPDEAYGEINKELVRELPRSALPKEMNVGKGGTLILKAPDGQQIPALISDVTHDKIVIDLNHPLAGKELTFKIRLVAIN